MSEYYLYENETQRGPFTLSQLQSMWRTGAITSQTLYCEEGYDEWLPLSSILDLLEPAVPAQPAPAARRPHTALTPPPQLKRGEVICPNAQCGYVGKPRKVARGSMLLGLLLCLIFILPGVIYLLLTSGYNYVCPQCGIHLRSGTHH